MKIPEEGRGSDGEGQLTFDRFVLMTSSRTTPPRLTLFARALTLGCPVCGQRGLHRRWLQLEERCPRCNFKFERAPGHFVGAVGINTITTFALILATMGIGVASSWPDAPPIGFLVAGVAVAVLFPILLHPFARLFWVAFDLMMTPLEPGEALAGPEPVAGAEKGSTK